MHEMDSISHIPLLAVICILVQHAVPYKPTIVWFNVILHAVDFFKSLTASFSDEKIRLFPLQAEVFRNTRNLEQQLITALSCLLIALSNLELSCSIYK